MYQSHSGKKQFYRLSNTGRIQRRSAKNEVWYTLDPKHIPEDVSEHFSQPEPEIPTIVSQRQRHYDRRGRCIAIQPQGQQCTCNMFTRNTPGQIKSANDLCQCGHKYRAHLEPSAEEEVKEEVKDELIFRSPETKEKYYAKYPSQPVLPSWSKPYPMIKPITVIPRKGEFLLDFHNGWVFAEHKETHNFLYTLRVEYGFKTVYPILLMDQYWPDPDPSAEKGDDGYKRGFYDESLWYLIMLTPGYTTGIVSLAALNEDSGRYNNHVVAFHKEYKTLHIMDSNSGEDVNDPDDTEFTYKFIRSRLAANGFKLKVHFTNSNLRSIHGGRGQCVPDALTRVVMILDGYKHEAFNSQLLRPHAEFVSRVIRGLDDGSINVSYPYGATEDVCFEIHNNTIKWVRRELKHLPAVPIGNPRKINLPKRH